MKNLTWMQYALVALALTLSAVLSYVGNELPGEAWALVGLLVGVAAPTPGLQAPTDGE